MIKFKKQSCKASGIYRSIDSISNFKISVTLKKLHSLIKIPTFELNQITGEDTDESNEIDVLTLRWQEKRFSHFEIDHYGVLENCKTTTQKEYNSTIKTNNLKSDNQLRIFTYTYDDNIHPENHNSSLKAMIESDNGNTHKGNSSTIPDEETESWQYMYIMADLKTEEVVLFKLKWRSSEGVLIVHPDFNDIATNPYFVEIDSDSRNMFYYGIKNLSLTSMDIQQRINTLESLTQNLFIEKNDNFDMPKTRFSRNFLILLEILTLEHFENDNCHVRYLITVPRDTEILEGDLKGSTHSSTTNNGKSLLGHCHNLLLSNESKSLDHLKIDYEVISIDSWGRERTEGRSMLAVPLKTGHQLKTISCYREVIKNRIYDWFHRFLIGGRFQFNSADFNGVSKPVEDITNLNRYGNETVSTGDINIKYCIVQQNHPQIDFIVRRNIKSTGKMKSIEDVVNAYYKAKDRLEEASAGDVLS